MFFAAFTSRSCSAPHSHVHSLWSKVKVRLMAPQQLQILLLGSNLPMVRMFLPYHSALYSICRLNSVQAASEIDFARQWFLSMFLTAKSSKQIDWFSLTSLVDSLCRKSFLWFATLSWIMATFSRCSW